MVGFSEDDADEKGVSSLATGLEMGDLAAAAPGAAPARSGNAFRGGRSPPSSDDEIGRLGAGPRPGGAGPSAGGGRGAARAAKASARAARKAGAGDERYASLAPAPALPAAAQHRSTAAAPEPPPPVLPPPRSARAGPPVGAGGPFTLEGEDEDARLLAGSYSRAP
jgi:hypothetical protein